jgi:hypothetical protein
VDALGALFPVSGILWGGIIQIWRKSVTALRRIFFASLFVLAATVIGVFLYSGMARLVSVLNGEPTLYPRFVPTEFDVAVSLALDLGLSCLATATLFYGIGRWRAIRASSPTPAVIADPQQTGVPAKAVRLRLRSRFWLLLAWFGVQFLYDLIAKTSAPDGVSANRLLEALSWMTTPIQLFTFLIVLVAVWKQPWKKKTAVAEHNGV